MRYSELVQSWPADMRVAQGHVLKAVRDGHILPLKFTTIEVQHPTIPGIRGRIRISNDALRFGDASESKRVAKSHETEQAVADLLGLRLPTMWLLDNAKAQATVDVEPIHNVPATGGQPLGHTSKRLAAEQHSDKLDEAIAGRDGLVVTTGKAWGNSNRLLHPERERYGKRTAINMGWHTDKAPVAPPTPGPRAGLVPGVQSWQREGGAHDVSHVDPSQWDQYVEPTMLVDTSGIVVPMAIDLVAMDPVLSPLVKHDGPGPMRHPWLPICSALGEGGSCTPASEPPPGGGPPPPASKARTWVAPVLVAGAAIGIAVAVSRWSEVG